MQLAVVSTSRFYAFPNSLGRGSDAIASRAAASVSDFNCRRKLRLDSTGVAKTTASYVLCALDSPVSCCAAPTATYFSNVSKRTPNNRPPWCSSNCATAFGKPGSSPSWVIVMSEALRLAPRLSRKTAEKHWPKRVQAKYSAPRCMGTPHQIDQAVFGVTPEEFRNRTVHIQLPIHPTCGGRETSE